MICFTHKYPSDAVVCRASFHAVIKQEVGKDAVKAAFVTLSETLKELQQQGRILTASLFQYEGHLFLYSEGVNQTLEMESLCPVLNTLLMVWPPRVEEHGAVRRWAVMQPYFYHAIPDTAEAWMENRHPEQQRGRIAVLPQNKWCSYMEHHLRLVSERILAGDRWHLICVHDNVLFSYFEDPRTNVNLCGNSAIQSKERDSWIACDPASHFLHFSQEQRDSADCNFVFLPRCAGT